MDLFEDRDEPLCATEECQRSLRSAAGVPSPENDGPPWPDGCYEVWDDPNSARPAGMIFRRAAARSESSELPPAKAGGF